MLPLPRPSPSEQLSGCQRKSDIPNSVRRVASGSQMSFHAGLSARPGPRGFLTSRSERAVGSGHAGPSVGNAPLSYSKQALWRNPDAELPTLLLAGTRGAQGVLGEAVLRSRACLFRLRRPSRTGPGCESSWHVRCVVPVPVERLLARVVTYARCFGGGKAWAGKREANVRQETH